MDGRRKLIGLIKDQKVLYNTFLSEYKDNASRTEAWKQVAEEMGMTVEECKAEWVKLRNSYVNALRRRVHHQNSTGKVLQPWILETELSFIKPFMTGRGWDDTPYSVLLREQLEETDDGSKTPKVEPENLIDDDPLNANEYENKNYTEINSVTQVLSDVDEMDLFFLGLSRTMKKLPRIEQCRLKMDLFKVVNEAEMKHLEGLRKRRRSSD